MALNIKTSITDFLKSKKACSTYSCRKKLAAKAGIKNYKGTAKQNTALLKYANKRYSSKSKQKQKQKQGQKQKQKQKSKKKPLTPKQLLAALPASVRNSKDFKNLSADLKLGLAQHFNVLSKGNKKAIKDWKDTLKVAQKQAAPYFKNILKIQSDELQRAEADLRQQLKYGKTETDIKIRQLKEDLLTGKERYTEQLGQTMAELEARREDERGTFEFNIDKLDTRIKEISEDLERNREFLTLEQQSDLGDLLRNYEKQVKSMRGSMAERGLSESSIRVEAKREIDEEDKSKVKTVQRRYTHQIKGMEIEAERGTEESEKVKAETERQYQSELETLGRRETELKSTYDFDISQLETLKGRNIGEYNRELKKLKSDFRTNLTALGRSFEETWGAKRLPSLKGYEPMGIKWRQSRMYETQKTDVNARRKALIDEQARKGLIGIY